MSGLFFLYFNSPKRQMKRLKEGLALRIQIQRLVKEHNLKVGERPVYKQPKPL